MSQKGHKFFADSRPSEGRRNRKSFSTPKAVLMCETQQVAVRPNSIRIFLVHRCVTILPRRKAK
jgi:hypothetical protein